MIGKMSQYPILALSACLHTAPGCWWPVVAVVWPRYFPDSGLTMEGAGRERRGGRDLYNCRVRTQAAATPTHNLNIINIFHPRTWAEERRKTARDGEMQRWRMCWGGGVQDMYPHQRLCPLRYVRHAFQRQLCLHAIEKRPLRTFCGRKSCSQCYLAVKKLG